MKKVLVLCLIFGLTVSGFLNFTLDKVHSENLITQNFENQELTISEIRALYIRSTNTSLSVTSGNASAYSSIIGYSGITTSVKITMSLEKRVLWWWSVQDTWIQTFYSYSGYLQRNAPVSGGTYRVRTVFVAYSGSNSEETVEYSEIITN